VVPALGIDRDLGRGADRDLIVVLHSSQPSMSISTLGPRTFALAHSLNRPCKLARLLEWMTERHH
jgi:hypothetical protein